MARQPAQGIAGTHVQSPRRARRSRWNPRVLVAAAVLLLCLLGGSLAWNISLNNQIATLQQQITRLTAHPTAPANVVSYTVNGTNPSQGATGQLYYYPKQNVTVLLMYRLPQPQGSHVYQGWLLHIKGKNITRATSIGLLNIVNGKASVSFSGDISGYDACRCHQYGGRASCHP